MHAMRIVGNLVVDPNETLIAFDTFWSIKRLFLMCTKCSLVSTRHDSDNGEGPATLRYLVDCAGYLRAPSFSNKDDLSGSLSVAWRN